MAESLKKLKTLNVFPSFICVRVEIDQLQCVISIFYVYKVCLCVCRFESVSCCLYCFVYM